MTRTRLAAVVAAAVVLSVTVPPVATADGSAALDLRVEDRDDGVLVTVSENGSAVADATVTVASVDSVIARDDYAGTGTYRTREDGTVSLPEPEHDVTVRVTASAGDSSVAERVRLRADDGEPLGAAVHSFVGSLLAPDGGGRDAGEDHTPLGRLISQFVRANAPDNQGTRAGQRGPPDHAGEAADGTRGPPARAANGSGDSGRSDASDDGGGPDHSGPPDHAGGSGDAGGGENESASGDGPKPPAHASETAHAGPSASAGGAVAGNGDGDDCRG